MLRFRPDIKPPMWGPLDAINFAVRANCEHIGLPMPLCFAPCWSTDFGENLFGGDAYFVSEGIFVNNTTWAHGFSLPVPQRTLTQFFFLNSVIGPTPQLLTFDSNILRATRLNVGQYRFYGNSNYLTYASVNLLADPPTNSESTWTGGWIRSQPRCRFSLTDKVLGFRTAETSNMSPITEVPIPSNMQFRFTGTSLCKFFAFWDVFPSESIDQRLHCEPYTLLMPVARPLYFDLGASEPTDITGTLSATESVTDTLAATGQLLVSGLMSVTEAGVDTASILGVLPVQGALSAVETDTDAASASGIVLIQGTLSATETGDDTFAAYGGAVSPITGTMAVTESEHDTATIIGQLLISGLMDVSEVGDDVFAAIGSALPAITGDMAVTETGVDIFAAAGVVTDTVTITAAEVARIVRASSRMKTVTAQARVKQVRYEVTRA